MCSSYSQRWLSVVLSLLCLFSFLETGHAYLPFYCHGCSCTETPSSSSSALSIDCRRLELTAIPEFLRTYTNYSTASQISIYLDYNNISTIGTDDLSLMKNLTRFSITYNQLSSIEDNAFSYQGFINVLDLSFNLLTSESFTNDSFKPYHSTQSKIITLKITDNLLTHPPRALARLPHISALFMDNNPMDPVLKHNAFEGYSEEIRELRLSGCQLRAIEPRAFYYKTFHSLKSLFLSYNNFDEIDERFLEGAHISDKLYLRDSGIHEIRNRTFRKQTALKHLYLDNNDLSRQHSRNCFAKMSLKTLSLTNCSMTRIKKGFLRLKAASINLKGNFITRLTNSTFNGLELIRELILDQNKINRIDGQPFQNLKLLRKLYLGNNEIDDSNLHFMGALSHLTNLDISHNKLTEFPDVSGLPVLTNIQASYNNIKEIKEATFNTSEYLSKLQLNDNRGLEVIDRNAFKRNNQIKMVDLSFSGLKRLPSFETFPALSELRLEHSKLTELPKDLCLIAPNLQLLYAYDNYLEAIPDLSNCTKLTHIELYYNRIKSIPELAFKGLSDLKTLTLYGNEITTVHRNAFRGLSSLHVLDLSHNKITYLPHGLFYNLTNLRKLELQFNAITNLPDNIFSDLKHLELLYINDNAIRTVGSVLFHSNMTWLQNLSVSNNPEMGSFPLPSDGFPFLHSLGMSNLPLIFNVPVITDIPRIQSIDFTYSYHCCIFKDYAPPYRKLALEESENTGDPDVLFTFHNTPAEEVTLAPEVSDTALFHGSDPFTHNVDHPDPAQFIAELLEYQRRFNVTLVSTPNGQVVVVDNGNHSIVARLKDEESRYLRTILPSFFVNREVYCTPPPSSLTPCDNLLDPQPLPVLVWVIWFTAVIANLAVLFVMIVSKEKLEVPHFFICNLAFADFLLGVYLAFLGAVDIRTRGKGFYKSALPWQTGPGCKTAGFIAIFSSELSVFILTFLTLERLHTIAYSFKSGRLRLRNATIIVFICWILAGILAALPLFDVNTYSDVAVCLPFRLSNIRDKLFIALILTVNLTAFFIILSSYLHILRLFCRSRASCTEQGNKREKIVISFKMGMLVLTNLICWLPLAVVGYAAIVDQHIIDFTIAKFFIILIFPINACLNPFIYSIFTKQFLSRVQGLCKRRDTMQHVSNNNSFYRLSFRRNSIASAASDTCSSTQRTNSPRFDIDLDMLSRRQNRRSFSVQLASPPLPQPIVGVASPAPNMGRRYSSPAIFGMESGDIQGPEGRGELPRSHSKCLSIVQEESDESDTEETTTCPSPRRRRRSSDPELLNSTLSGGLKDLLNARSNKVSDERRDSGLVPSFEGNSPLHYQSVSPAQSNTVIRTVASGMSHSRVNATPGTSPSYRVPSPSSPAAASRVHFKEYIARRSSPLSTHSVRIINPHTAKQSKQNVKESQV